MAKKRSRGSRKNSRLRKKLRVHSWTMWNDEIEASYHAMNKFVDHYYKVERAIEKAKHLRWLLLGLMERQNHRCCYCGTITWHPRYEGNNGVKEENWNRATLEHYKPKSEGGKDHHSNLVMACSQCNGVRGSIKPEEFIQTIQASSNDPVATPKKEKSVEKLKQKEARLFKLLYLAAALFPKEYNNALENMEKTVATLRQKPKRENKNALNKIRKRVASIGQKL